MKYTYRQKEVLAHLGATENGRKINKKAQKQ